MKPFVVFQESFFEINHTDDTYLWCEICPQQMWFRFSDQDSYEPAEPRLYVSKIEILVDGIKLSRDNNMLE